MHPQIEALQNELEWRDKRIKELEGEWLDQPTEFDYWWVDDGVNPIRILWAGPDSIVGRKYCKVTKPSLRVDTMLSLNLANNMTFHDEKGVIFQHRFENQEQAKNAAERVAKLLKKWSGPLTCPTEEGYWWLDPGFSCEPVIIKWRKDMMPETPEARYYGPVKFK